MLDVIRGAAILLVMLRHSWPTVFPGAGIVGVISFFVLSGFLITGVLLRDINAWGRVRYGRFYAHRAFRLLPALVAFLSCYAAIELCFGLLGDRGNGLIVPTLIVALTYVTDFPLPFHVSQAIGPLWTLAVEEQFYLVWPALLVAATRRRKQLLLVAGAAAAIYGCMVLSVVATSTLLPDKFIYVYSLPTTWGTGLVVGAGLRLFREPATALLLRIAHPRAICWASIALLTAFCFYPDAKTSPLFYVVGGPIIASTAAMLVLLASKSMHTLPLAMALQSMGTISYAAYLWNYAILLWLSGGHPLHASWIASLGTFVLTILVATASWYTVERLGRHLRARFDVWYDRRSAPESEHPR